MVKRQGGRAREAVPVRGMHFPREDSEIITDDISSATGKTGRLAGRLAPLLPLLALKVAQL